MTKRNEGKRPMNKLILIGICIGLVVLAGCIKKVPQPEPTYNDISVDVQITEDIVSYMSCLDRDGYFFREVNYTLFVPYHQIATSRIREYNRYNLNLPVLMFRDNVYNEKFRYDWSIFFRKLNLSGQDRYQCRLKTLAWLNISKADEGNVWKFRSLALSDKFLSCSQEPSDKLWICKDDDIYTYSLDDHLFDLSKEITERAIRGGQ